MYSSTQCKDIRKKDEKFERLKKSKDKITVKMLQSIYDLYGANSKEFYDAIKNLINFLQYKYMGRIDEDCFNDCYVRILESFDYFDPTRSNIISWIHLVVRNKVSSFCYTHTKKKRESYEYNDTVTCGNETDELAVKDTLRSFLINSGRVKVSTLIVDDLVDTLYFNQNHPLYKSSFWRDESEEILCLSKKSPLNIVIQ